jgi:hypothetical protein
MRVLVYFAALVLLGCGSSHETIDVARLSTVLAQASPKTSYDLSLKLVEVERGGRDLIHCVLENTSSGPITIDASTLPWETPGFFDVNAVTPDGEVVRRRPIVTVLSSAPTPVTIEAGKSLEGDFEAQDLPFDALPRSHDLLLLWSYGISSPDPHLLSGTLALKKR